MNKTNQTDGEEKMAKIGGERGITMTIKFSTWQKLKKLHIDRKMDDKTMSDTLDSLLDNYNKNIKR